MSDISENLRAFLVADASIAAKVASRIHEDHVPEATGTKLLTPFIWFRKRSALSLDTLAPSAGEAPYDFSFDVECVGRRQSDAKDLAELVRAKCNFYRGALGTQTAMGVFVNDQDDDYEAQATGGDDGLFVAALDLRAMVQV